MELINEIEAFCAKHEMTEGQFGLGALNDKNFVIDLRNGRDLRMSTLERVRNWMAEYVRGVAA